MVNVNILDAIIMIFLIAKLHFLAKKLFFDAKIFYFGEKIGHLYGFTLLQQRESARNAHASLQRR